MKSIFDDKILLIPGGTGSFGNAVLKRFLQTEIREIRIFSRDEKKQDDMRQFYNNSKINISDAYLLTDDRPVLEKLVKTPTLLWRISLNKIFRDKFIEEKQPIYY